MALVMLFVASPLFSLGFDTYADDKAYHYAQKMTVFNYVEITTNKGNRVQQITNIIPKTQIMIHARGDMWENCKRPIIGTNGQMQGTWDIYPAKFCIKALNLDTNEATYYKTYFSTTADGYTSDGKAKYKMCTDSITLPGAGVKYRVSFWLEFYSGDQTIESGRMTGYQNWTFDLSITTFGTINKQRSWPAGNTRYTISNDFSYSNKGSDFNPNKLAGCVFSVGKQKTTTSISVKAKANYSSNTIQNIPSNVELLVYEVSGNYGKVTYNGVTGWVNLYYCKYQGPSVTKPVAPTVTLKTAPDIPITGLATVEWNSVYDAKYYSAVVYDQGGNEKQRTDNIYGTTASFCLRDPGDYTIKVYGKNSLYTGDPGASGVVHVHANSTVTYYDEDGTTLIGIQKPYYNENATAPLAPERKGYTFKSWIGGSMNNIREDKTFTASYTKNEYQVQFYDFDGKKYGPVQRVKYLESAMPPDDLPTPANYDFVGWDSNKWQNVYTENKNDVIEIHPVFSWKLKELPIEIVSAVETDENGDEKAIPRAEREDNGYTVRYRLKNHAELTKSLRGRVVVCLKSDSDKLLWMSESSAFSMKPNAVKTADIFIPYEKAASKVDLLVISDYANGIPISEKKTIDEIDGSLMWTDWSETQRTDLLDGVEEEKRTEYSYDMLETKWFPSSKITGDNWMRTSSARKETPVYTSGWSDNPISGYEYDEKGRRVDTQQVKVENQRTVYQYYHWTGIHNGERRWSPYQEGTSWVKHEIELDYTLGQGYKGTYSYYGGYSCPHCGASNMWSGGTARVEDNSYWKAQYRYTDYNYTYEYSRFHDPRDQFPDKWSEWSTEKVEPITGVRQVAERTLYRYRSNGPEVTTVDDSGEIRHLNHAFGTGFAGKQVTIFISKYKAASDFTNEYIGQTVIGADGTISLAYKLRETPSEETGDMTIFAGIEGTTEMLMIGVIEAPKPSFTVKYMDEDDTVILERTVLEGENAEAPESYVPEKPGFTFAGWNNTGTNVHSDLEIRPIFVENVYLIYYVDYRNPDESFHDPLAHAEEYKYAELVPTGKKLEGVQNVESADARTEWRSPDGEADEVRGNMVLTAAYNPKEYVVTFETKGLVPPTESEENLFDYDRWIDGLNTKGNPLNYDGGFSINRDKKMVSITTPEDADHRDVYTKYDLTDDMLYSMTVQPNATYVLSFDVDVQKTGTGSWQMYLFTDFDAAGADITKNGDTASTDSSLQHRGVGDNTRFVFTTGADAEKLQLRVGNKNGTGITSTFSNIQIHKIEEDIKKVTEYEGAVIAPEIEDTEDFTFLGWDVEQEDLIDITENFSVTPIFVYNETTAAPQISLESGAYTGTQTVTLSSETEDAVIYYTLDGSDPQENPLAIEYTGPFTVSETAMLNCYAGSLGRNDSEVETAYYVLNGNGAIVHVHSDLYPEESETDTFLVTDMSEIDTTYFDADGQTLIGIYTDAAHTQTAVLTGAPTATEIDLYLAYEANVYTVTFQDLNGNTVKTVQVQYGESIEPPEMERIGTMVCIGWEGGDYDFVTEDATLQPIYKEESEIVKLTLNRSSFEMPQGLSFKLNATVTPADKSDLEVIWISEDDTIASVAEDGTVTANAPGTVKIYAVTEDDSAQCFCEVTVTRSPNFSLCLKETATMGLDTAGNLRGAPVEGNTVDFIASQFRNAASTLRFMSADREILTGSDRVGTGATVSLMDGDNVLDTWTVIHTGDVNYDGKVDNQDVSLMLRFSAKMVTFDEYQCIAADVNGDGKLNLRDASYLMRALVGKETL